MPTMITGSRAGRTSLPWRRRRLGRFHAPTAPSRCLPRACRTGSHFRGRGGNAGRVTLRSSTSRRGRRSPILTGAISGQCRCVRSSRKGRYPAGPGRRASPPHASICRRRAYTRSARPTTGMRSPRGGPGASTTARRSAAVAHALRWCRTSGALARHGPGAP